MKLIIAEKPSVAGEIAKVVGADKKERGYWTGNDYIVSWCVGHLVEPVTPEGYDPALKKWSMDTLPIIPEHFKTEVVAATVEQFNILRGLMDRQDVTELVEATDAGREGELIFRLVYHQAGCTKPFRRLWISSMEAKSIRDGMAALKPGAEYDNLYRAALCRQQADWLIGINLTRFYTKAYDKRLPCGRVQTPTLALLVQRQNDIKNFMPVTYYSMTANFGTFRAYKRVDTKTEADELQRRCTGPATVSSVEREEQTDNPPRLFDLTALQKDANRVLGYSAQETLDYMQRLYDSKLATYPRTDSSYLTADMEASTGTLVNTLLSAGVFSDQLVQNYHTADMNIPRVINNAKVTDHHAIIPTMEVTAAKLEGLPTGERNILLLICHRLLSAIYRPQRYAATKAILTMGDVDFTATGREVLDAGYRTVEAQAAATVGGTQENDAEDADQPSENTLPALTEGATLQPEKLTCEKKKTKPPKSYTEADLLAAMETAGKRIEDEAYREAMKERGLGTSATRAATIESLIKSGYIIREKKKMLPTPVGYTFIDLATQKIKTPELTAQWEKDLADIQRGEASDVAFMEEVTSFIRTFIAEGKATVTPADSNQFKQERPSLGTCPICGKAVVDYPKSFSCESGKDSCGFVIWKQIAGKPITEAQAQKLLTKGKSDLIKGFKGKSGNTFDAYLIFKEDKSVGFQFPEKKKTGGS